MILGRVQGEVVSTIKHPYYSHRRVLLLDKIEKRRTGRVEAERARIEKIRRQKRKRSRRAREKMLADKSHHSAKKASRRTLDLD